MKRAQTRARPRSRKPSRTARERVKLMRALGRSEDAIAHALGVHKNTLRAAHAPDLDAGRELARAGSEAAATSELTVRELETRKAFFAGFNSEWTDPVTGCNDLQNGKTLAEAETDFADWLKLHRKVESDAA